MGDRLAIDGGTPVRTDPLPYGRHSLDESDVEAVVAALKSGWLTTGPEVEAYERALAEYVGARHAVAVSSGTAALHAAATIAGLGPEDEAIVPPISFAATANCVRYCGARPVFADIDPDTGNIDPAAVDAVLTERTRAIIPVHYAGQPVDLDAIRAFANKHGLTVIEDAAHALGARYQGTSIGADSDLVVLSTHPVKAIATGEGGAIVTNDSEKAARLGAFRSHGVSVNARTRDVRGDWYYEMDFLAYNYRIPDLCCALGRSQLKRLDGFLARRKAIAERYGGAFNELAEVEPLSIREDRESAWHLYVIRLALERLQVDRKQVYRALRAEGIGVNVHYIPIYRHPYYQAQGYVKGLCPRAEEFYERIVTLPLWPGMADKDADDVITAVFKVAEAYRA